MTVRTTDVAGNVKTVETNENGLITRITDANGSTVEYTYNARGQEQHSAECGGSGGHFIGECRGEW